jgi:lipopolysaccharide export system ATP-binding protein
LIVPHGSLNFCFSHRQSDRAYIISEGKILISGTSRELADNPEARRIYLGQKFKLD